VAAVIDTLTLEGTQIAAVTAFLVAEQPSDEADHFLPQSAFERFGLPVELPAE
jgi:hypothetical protein